MNKIGRISASWRSESRGERQQTSRKLIVLLTGTKQCERMKAGSWEAGGGGAEGGRGRPLGGVDC